MLDWIFSNEIASTQSHETFISFSNLAAAAEGEEKLMPFRILPLLKIPSDSIQCNMCLCIEL